MRRGLMILWKQLMFTVHSLICKVSLPGPSAEARPNHPMHVSSIYYISLLLIKSWNDEDSLSDNCLQETVIYKENLPHFITTGATGNSLQSDCVQYSQLLVTAIATKVIASHQRGTGDHRVGQWWEGVMDQEDSYKTLIGVHSTMHPN